jgi:glycosyltransferase involved in cell wall biosynthesis
MNKDSVIIIMPVYNEEECIEGVVKSWIDVIKKLPVSELLVLNDGSTDNTGSILAGLAKNYSEIKVVEKNNEGHGRTLRKGYQEAAETNFNWVFQTDSDNQFIASDFFKLWNERNKSSFITGYRKKRSDPLPRLILTKTLVIFNLLIFWTFIKDSNIPFRLIKRDYLQTLLKSCPGYVNNVNIFLSIMAKKDGQDLREIPLTHLERKTGKVSNVKMKLLKVCFKGLKQLLLFRIHLSAIMKNLKKY